MARPRSEGLALSRFLAFGWRLRVSVNARGFPAINWSRRSLRMAPRREEALPEDHREPFPDHRDPILDHHERSSDHPEPILDHREPFRDPREPFLDHPGPVLHPRGGLLDHRDAIPDHRDDPMDHRGAPKCIGVRQNVSGCARMYRDDPECIAILMTEVNRG